MTASHPDVLPSPLAGRWYPANSEALAGMVDGFLNEANPAPPTGEIVGLLAPHAGLIYSGPVAAYAFTLLENMAPELVAIVCPSHHPYTHPALTTAHDRYETPLGQVPVDHDAIDALSKLVPLAPVRNDAEHALEIELPFLQRVLQQGFKLLPIMVVDQSSGTTEALGHALARIMKDRNGIMIASSDLSHFYPQQVANQHDSVTLKAIRSFDPLRVLRTGKNRGEGACGKGAIAAVMWAARDLGANRADILHYATSGDTSGNYSQVVGYAAGVFYNNRR